VSETRTWLTPALAQRLERAHFEKWERMITLARETGLYPDATCQSFAGGMALWMGPDCVINGAWGAGLDGPVTAQDVSDLVDFFERHGSPRVVVDVCPLAHESLLIGLGAAGFVADGFETVLITELPQGGAKPQNGSEGALDVRILTQSDADRDLAAELNVRGFREQGATEGDWQFARLMAARPDLLCFCGTVGGVPAGIGMLRIDEDGSAWLTGDSTLPEFRGRGVQQALLRTRLSFAAEEGSTLAVIEAKPGGTSQRNQERVGFRPLYTRVTLVRTASR